MSATHPSLNRSQSGILLCTRCNTEIPRHATFCGHCGERIEQNSGDSSSPKHADITTRYRITSLLRRQPPAQLFLALDTQHQRPVVILDIDISTLDDSGRSDVIEAQHYQYELLRRLRIPAIMPPIDLRFFNGHLSTISGWPFVFTTKKQSHSVSEQLFTLHHLLQSGIGLPSEEVAIAWVYRICQAIEQLHRHSIMPGDLDPQTLLISKQDYSGEPILSVFWMADPQRVQSLSTTSSAQHPSPFRAPETLQGEVAPCSDVYSLGALLYLLLTGVTPPPATQREGQPLASLLDLNPRANSTLNSVVMQTLALPRIERYQSAAELATALEPLLTTRQEITSNVEPQDIHENMQTAIHNTSIVADKNNNLDDVSSPRQESDDATVSVVPLQAQLARRYLSRLKSSHADIHYEAAREEFVEAGVDKKNINEGTANELMKNNTSGLHTSGQDLQTAPIDHTMADKHFLQSVQPTEAENTSGTITKNPPVQEVQDQNTPPNTNLPLQEHTDLPSEEGGTPVVESLEPTIRITAKDIKDTLAASPYDVAQLEALSTHPDEEGHDEESAELPSTGSQNAIKQISSPAEAPETKKEPTSQPIERAMDHAVSRFKEIFIGPLPALSRRILSKETQPGNAITHTQGESESDHSFFKRVQHFLLGEQVHTTSHAALIETPMRVQPNRSYSIRINIIGRPSSKRIENGGLSALGEGDIVHIEVRSALYQNYAYIVQQANIAIPDMGYIAEITMPMQPLSSGPSGRRERLHIFFMDEHHDQLYEKPFVIELFISPRVHNGREGHNVLSIPL